MKKFKGQVVEELSVKIRTVLEMLVVPIIGYGVYLLSDMNRNIQTLNTQVAVILYEKDAAKEAIKDLELRVRYLEKGEK